VAATALPVLAMRAIHPVTSAFMLERRFFASGERACEAIRYHWEPWREISPEAALAVIASEDQRFAEHAGFDVDAIEKALRARWSGGPRRGASTISQQVAKNLFLWPGRSFVRKGLEAWFTVWIEALWPKRRILEVYLNVAQFGRCTFGVGAASELFFRKRPAELDLAEAALLAAVLPNPVRLRVDAPSPQVRGRAAWIERQVRHLGGAAFLAELGF